MREVCTVLLTELRDNAGSGYRSQLLRFLGWRGRPLGAPISSNWRETGRALWRQVAGYAGHMSAILRQPDGLLPFADRELETAEARKLGSGVTPHRNNHVSEAASLITMLDGGFATGCYTS